MGPAVGARMTLRAGGMTRTVTVVGSETSLSHGLRWLVTWPSRVTTGLLPGQATALCSAYFLRAVS